MNGNSYLADVTLRFRETKQQCEQAIAQVPFELWSRRLDPESNSLITLMLHLSGNMLSRWTDFLASDGEKPGRDRDAEFEDAAGLSREALLERWERGWMCLFVALERLTDADLGRTITIRSSPLRVFEAIQRQFAHYSQHAGQMIFLAKHLAGDRWETLSVPRGGSAAFNRTMMPGPPKG